GRGQERPLTGETTKEAVKPLRGEGGVVPAKPVVTPLVCFFHMQARLRVLSAPDFPCALSCGRGTRNCKSPGEIALRGCLSTPTLWLPPRCYNRVRAKH